MPRSESPSVFSYAMHGIVQVETPSSLVIFVAEPFATSSFSIAVSKLSAPNATAPSAAFVAVSTSLPAASPLAYRTPKANSPSINARPLKVFVAFTSTLPEAV